MRQLIRLAMLGGLCWGLLGTGCTADPVSRGEGAEGEGEGEGTEGEGEGTEGEGAEGEGEVTVIRLLADAIEVEGDGVDVDGPVATITAAGRYTVRGRLDDGQLRIDTDDDADVEVLFDGVDIHCSTCAPFFVVAAEDVKLELAAGTANELSDEAGAVPEDGDEPNAALFSRSDLKIKGSGSLTVVGLAGDGIASKDSLTIKGGTLDVQAADDGLRGKDDVTIEGGTVTIEAGGDGITSDNATEPERGYIELDDGLVTITAAGDGLAAATSVDLFGGELTITAGGGAAGFVGANDSAKGIKGLVGVRISGGTIDIDAADDAVHSNGAIVVSGGTLTLATGDDGMHADATIGIEGGEITIRESFEGLEAATITIDDGTIHITATDDGLNAGGGADGSGTGGGRPRPGDEFPTGTYSLAIHGGYLYVDADGDGLDSNGSIDVTGGTVLVDGPTGNMNGPLDIEERSGHLMYGGGFLIAVGSSGMAVGASPGSTQYSVLIYLTSQQRAGTLVHLRTGDGEELFTFQPVKAYQSVSFTSPDLGPGTHEIFLGGSSTGTLTDGRYTGGSYSGGSRYASFTISSINTTVGQGGGPRP